VEECVVVFVTAASAEEAEKIARALVEEKLAACGNVIPGLKSIFRWEGEMCAEDEVLLVLKTRRERFDAVVRRIKELHSYDVPEIVCLPIVAGSEDYLDWVRQETE